MLPYFYLTGGMVIISGIISAFGKEHRKKDIKTIVCILMLTSFSALRANEVGSDTSTYLFVFQRIKDIDFNSIISRQAFTVFEPGYLLLCKLFSLLGTDDQYFKIWTSILAIAPVGWFVRKYSYKPVFSFVLYCLSTHFLFTMCIIRQSLALSVLLFAYDAAFQKNKGWIRKVVILTLIATSFHVTAAIGFILIPMALIEKPDAKYYLITVGSIFGIALLGERISNTLFAGSKYLQISDFGIGRLIIPLTVLILIFFYRNALYNNDQCAKWWEQFSVISLLLNIMSFFFIMTSRTSLLFSIANIVVLPNTIKSTERNQQLIFGFLVLLIHIVLFVAFFDKQFTYVLAS